MSVPLKKRARHKLFNDSEVSAVNGGPTVNYDIEAIKLDRVRQAWPGCAPTKNIGLSRLSISSEESISDCEELGANHDNYHRESQTYK